MIDKIIIKIHTKGFWGFGVNEFILINNILIFSMYFYYNFVNHYYILN